LQELLDHMAQQGGWPVSKDLRMTIKDNAAIDVTVDGQPLDPKHTYKMVAHDYLANGGDGLLLLESLPRASLGYLVRDALIAHVRALTAAGESINAEKDGRVRVASN